MAKIPKTECLQQHSNGERETQNLNCTYSATNGADLSYT